MTDAIDDFGPCCGCGKPNDETVRNMMHLTFEAPDGFHGWSCFVCGIPDRGAVAMLCDDCIEKSVEPKFIAGGKYLMDRVRVPLEGYVRKPFDHIREKHPELQQ